MDQVCEPYIRRRAVRHLEKGRVVHLRRGHRQPLFHHRHRRDAARQRDEACEAIFKGTKVDGVYDKDPKKHADAKRFDTVSYDEVLAQHLGVMDASAIALARENDVPIIVFSLDEPGGFRGYPRRAGDLHQGPVTLRPGGAMREIQFWNINRDRGKPLKTTANRTRRSGAQNGGRRDRDRRGRP
jgi:hypothetical protein